MPIFSQNRGHLIIGPKFGEIAQLGAIFRFKYCWGVPESWVEAEMSWVVVDGPGWRVKSADWRWMELGGGGWRSMKLGGDGCTV